MTECKFCAAMKTHKQVNEILDRNAKNRGEEKMLREMTVAIVTHTWTKERGKRNAGRSTDYRYRGLGYKLKYCPECGREIERGE